jgi:hydroxypyruvate reductase
MLRWFYRQTARVRQLGARLGMGALRSEVLLGWAPPMPEPDLAAVFNEVARRVDGAALLRRALAEDPDALGRGPLRALSIGKVAFPMLEGLLASIGPQRFSRGLVVAPATRFPKHPSLPDGFTALVSDHPDPSERSMAAGRAALELTSHVPRNETLVVLLSGGSSAAMALPTGDLSLEDKRATTKLVARAGASIAELNTVRKHLSAIKGGRLAASAHAPTRVFALSDVVGNDPATIGSGPFSADPSTFAQALAIIERLAPAAPARAIEHLRRGAAGLLEETPKPGDPRLAHCSYRLVAGPERVVDEALDFARSTGAETGALSRNTEATVSELAALYGRRAREEAAIGGRSRIFVGNGEPTIVVTGHGNGGRATHLALEVAREIAGIANVSFLAAGTDDRDGATDGSGAVVDGTTWRRAEEAGLHPAGALAHCDSATPLQVLGCIVRGPGTSNLLDLHLLGVGSA